MFQSTRPRGRTRLGICMLVVLRMRFQSTRPRGRTRLIDILLTKPFHVSIHASSREDATNPALTLRVILCFNPRVLAGGRDAIKNKWFYNIWFQSTRPRGRTRLCFKCLSICILCFNPRVLAGGRDRGDIEITGTSQVSIHASSREDATF